MSLDENQVTLLSQWFDQLNQQQLITIMTHSGQLSYSMRTCNFAASSLLIFSSSMNSSYFEVYRAGLPNQNFENQEFEKKNQESFRRIFSLNQEKNQEIFFDCSPVIM
jgi:hypothetical protein